MYGEDCVNVLPDDINYFCSAIQLWTIFKYFFPEHNKIINRISHWMDTIRFSGHKGIITMLYFYHNLTSNSRILDFFDWRSYSFPMNFGIITNNLKYTRQLTRNHNQASDEYILENLYIFNVLAFDTCISTSCKDCHFLMNALIM